MKNKLLILILLFTVNIFSQKIVYKTDNGMIVGWVDKLIDTTSYKLKSNEIFGNRFINPFWDGNKLIEKVFTQSEIDQIEENEAERLQYDEFIKDYEFGKEACFRLRTYLIRKVNPSNYEAAKLLIEPIFEDLRKGYIEDALKKITVIDNANSTAISRTIKAKIEEYLNQ